MDGVAGPYQQGHRVAAAQVLGRGVQKHEEDQGDHGQTGPEQRALRMTHGVDAGGEVERGERGGKRLKVALAEAGPPPLLSGAGESRH